MHRHLFSALVAIAYPLPSNLFASAIKAPKAERNRWLATANAGHSYVLPDIARHLGLHDAIISKVTGPANPTGNWQGKT